MKVFKGVEIASTYNYTDEFILKSDHEAAMALKDAQLEFLKDKIREQVHYDSANYLRGSPGYSPKAIEAEVDERMVALESALQRLAKG